MQSQSSLWLLFTLIWEELYQLTFDDFCYHTLLAKYAQISQMECRLLTFHWPLFVFSRMVVGLGTLILFDALIMYCALPWVMGKCTNKYMICDHVQISKWSVQISKTEIIIYWKRPRVKTLDPLLFGIYKNRCEKLHLSTYKVR